MMQFRFLSFEWLKDKFAKLIERSFQKQANRMFEKSRVKYRDGDNT